jgi:hypothetical protein
MNQMTVVLIVVAIVVIIGAAFLYAQKQRTKRLKTQFGPEYERLAREGDARKAEAELASRQRRVEKLHLRELRPTDIDRFSNSWRSVQAQFVDSPSEAVVEADRLVREVMTARGYAMGNFEQQAADISVDHPQVVDNYRRAHKTAVADANGQATTEDLRQAMVYYRSLFDDLLTSHLAHRVEEVKR